MIRVPLLLIVLISSVSTLAQSWQHRADSLSHALESSKKDSNRISLLLELSSAYYHIETNRSLEIAEEALYVSQEIGYKRGAVGSYAEIIEALVQLRKLDEAKKYLKEGIRQASAEKMFSVQSKMLHSKALMHRMRSEFDSAIVSFEHSIELSRKLSDSAFLSVNYSDMGAAYRQMGEFTKAADHLFKAIRISERLDRKSQLANQYGNLAIVFAQQNDPEKAKEYFTNALNIHEELGDSVGVASDLGNLGNLSLMSRDNEMAVEYYLKAAKRNKRLADPRGLAANYSNASVAYRRLDQFALALMYCQKAAEINQEIENRLSYIKNLINIGVIYQEMATNDSISPEFTAAEKRSFLEHSVASAKEARTLQKEIGSVNLEPLELLVEAYKALGDFEKALKASEQLYQGRDSIEALNMRQELAEMESKYLAEQSELETRQLQLESESNALQLKAGAAIVVLLTLLIITLTITTIRNRKLSRADHSLEDQIPD